MYLKVFFTEDYRPGNCELKTTGWGQWAERLGAAGSARQKKRCRLEGGRIRPFNVSDFKKLHVWQKAHALAVSVDRVCRRIRGSQYASLRNQLFRAAASIPAVVAQTITVRKMLYALIRCIGTSNPEASPRKPGSSKSPRPPAGSLQFGSKESPAISDGALCACTGGARAQ